MIDDPSAAVRRHIDAFNDGDLEALLAGFTDDAVWVTGTSVARGGVELADLFKGAISQLRPHLALESVIAEGDRVACQITETLSTANGPLAFSIAGFYRLRGGLIASAKIYREGSAEIG